MAYRPVRPEALSAHPMLRENLASGSERKSCLKRVSHYSKEKRCLGGTHDAVAHSVHLAPCAHHKGIVGCEDCNDVHTLLLQLGEVLNIAREVVDGASGGEGACDGSIWLINDS